MSVVAVVVVPALASGPAGGLVWTQRVCCWQFVGDVGMDVYLLEVLRCPLPFQKNHPAVGVEKVGVDFHLFLFIRLLDRTISRQISQISLELGSM